MIFSSLRSETDRFDDRRVGNGLLDTKTADSTVKSPTGIKDNRHLLMVFHLIEEFKEK